MTIFNFLDILSFLLFILSLLAMLMAPVLLVVFVVFALLRKFAKIPMVFPIISGICLIVCILSIVPICFLGLICSPSFWCEHEYEVVEEIEPTCDREGEIHKYCSLCEHTRTEYIDKLPHRWVVTSRTESTSSSEGKVIYRCEQCGQEKTETLTGPGDSPNSDNNKDYVVGEVVDGTMEDIETDNIVEKLSALGFTESEAREIREIFLKCGLTNIDNAEPTDPNATIDGLVAFRVIIDEDRTAWFTVENREVFYIGLNGTDVYDTSQGGFLINIEDVHVPENDISHATADKLKDLTISAIDPYFVNALWYDGFRYGRSDDSYMVQCEVYAQNRLGVKDWVYAKVWYEFDGTNFVTTAIVIDGVRYK